MKIKLLPMSWYNCEALAVAKMHSVYRITCYLVSNIDRDEYRNAQRDAVIGKLEERIGVLESRLMK